MGELYTGMAPSSAYLAHKASPNYNKHSTEPYNTPPPSHHLTSRALGPSFIYEDRPMAPNGKARAA